jgi:hypothetical protein
MDLLNDIVNNKEKLLEDLRNFTNKLYEKDNRIKNISLGGWEVIAKKLNKKEDNMKISINKNIVSSDDNMYLIISTLNSDKDKYKDNELYRIIMNKNNIITQSINMLNSSENYNKNTEDTLNSNDTEINELNTKIKDKMMSLQKVQSKTMSQSKYSHSYNSSSSSSSLRSMLQGNININSNNSELLLINAIGDGDCFINAVFDYGLYTGKLSDIYDRLIHLELLIANIQKYKNIINKVKLFFVEKPKLDILNREEYATILENKLIKEGVKETKAFKEKYKIPEEQILICYHHPYPQDRKLLSKEYEIERKKFINFMKYIQVLYIYTYGNKIIIKKLTETFNIAKNAELLNHFDFDTTFIEHIKSNYYDKKGNLIEPINIPDFLDDYMNFYANTNGYYSGQDQILIFKKIFFKKLKLKSSGQPIPCFWLNYEFVGSINLSIKKIKFMKTLRESLEEDNNKNFISIIRDGEHFKLFLYRDQTIYVKSIYE